MWLSVVGVSTLEKVGMGNVSASSIQTGSGGSMVVNGRSIRAPPGPFSIINGRIIYQGRVWTGDDAAASTDKIIDKSGTFEHVPELELHNLGRLTIKTDETVSECKYKLKGRAPTDVDFKLVDGRFDVEDTLELWLDLVVKPDASVTTVNCPTEMQGRYRQVDFNGMHHGLSLTEFQAPVLNFKSMSGDFRARFSTIGRLSASTMSGDVSVTNNSKITDTSMCKTMSGDVRLSGFPARVQASTMSGDRDIARCNEGPRITASTMSGDVSYDYTVFAPVAAAPAPSAPAPSVPAPSAPPAAAAAAASKKDKDKDKDTRPKAKRSKSVTRLEGGVIVVEPDLDE